MVAIGLENKKIIKIIDFGLSKSRKIYYKKFGSIVSDSIEGKRKGIKIENNFFFIAVKALGMSYRYAAPEVLDSAYGRISEKSDW